MFSIEENILLAPFTTLKVGGPARFFTKVTSLEEIKQAVKFAKDKKLKISPLDGGSNILVSDDGVDGLVIKMENQGREWNEINDDFVNLKVSAGEEWDDLVDSAVKKNLYGLENLSGIPGTVGAAPVQNIGAYGVEISDVIVEVEVFDIEKEEVLIFKKNDCCFGYRDSLFKDSLGRFIILSVIMCLSKKPKVVAHYKDIDEKIREKNKKLEISDLRDLVLDIRSKKFPDMDKLGSAGSFFKNPVVSATRFNKIQKKYPDIPFYAVGSEYVKIPLAWILDKVLNLRGVKKGKTGLFHSQPLVLIAYENATQQKILSFAEEIKRKVKEATDIDVEYEVKILS
jgi:UDP-N-acetylmuramate dehydrogenase